MRIKTGDKVIVLSGKDAGKTGKVVQMFMKERKASVEGVNLSFKHLRRQKEGQHGQKVQFPAPLYTDKLMLVCPKCGKPARVGTRMEGEKRIRVCKKCKAAIE